MNWLDQIRRLTSNLPELVSFRIRSAEFFLTLLVLAVGLLYWLWPSRPSTELLNIAFDAAQPLYVEIDAAWKKQSGKSAHSLHAGSIRQTQTLTSVLAADTICVSSAFEMDTLANKGVVARDWRIQFPEEASPFHSYIVFLARRGAADHIQNWPDLLETNLRYALPSPDVSGAGMHAYLALAYHAEKEFGDKGWMYLNAVKNAVFFPYGARRCTQIFTMDPSLDLLVTWESEALRVIEEDEASEFRLIYPKALIRLEVAVAIAMPNTEFRGTRQNADHYLRFLYSSEGGKFIKAAGFHPTEVDGSSTETRPTTSIESLFGSWQTAIDQHLDEDGSYNRLSAFRKARSGGSE